jgi:hypothetical protein
MAKTYVNPSSRVGRLLTRADRLTGWSRAQAYTVNPSRPGSKRLPPPHAKS